MTVRRAPPPPKTYEARMLAELDREDSDADDDGVRGVEGPRKAPLVSKRLPAATSARSSKARAMGSAKEAQEASTDDEPTTSDEEPKARPRGEPKTTAVAAAAAVPGASHRTAEDDHKHRHSSFPPSSQSSSSHQSRKSPRRDEKQVKDGDDNDDDDDDSDGDSEHEREARVRPQDVDKFAGTSGVASPESIPSATAYRAEINALRAFLTKAPRQGAPTIRCYVERDRRGLHRLHPVYRLFLDDGKQFLMCAQKRGRCKTSNYLLTMERNPTDRRSALIVGKLRANWSGSTYTIFDDGLSPTRTAVEANTRGILGFVEFGYDEMGPGRLNVRIPPVSELGAAATKWTDPDLDRDSLARAALELNVAKSALDIRNKRPQYDAKTGGHVLDFRGRVTMPSIKNFQLQCDRHGDATILQFGRVSCQPPGPRAQCKCHKDVFTMDLQHPLSPVQAFAICLATLDDKVADGKMYDSVAKMVQRPRPH